MKPYPVLALLADDPSAPGIGTIPGLIMFLVALFVVALMLFVSAQRRLWETGTVTLFVWLCAGLLMRPWTFFTNQSKLVSSDLYWGSCWKLVAIIWVLSLLLGSALVIAIARSTKSRHHRRRRRHGEHRQRGERSSRKGQDRDDGNSKSFEV